MQTKDCGPRSTKLATPAAGVGLEKKARVGRGQRAAPSLLRALYSLLSSLGGTHYLLYAVLKPQHTAEEQQVGQEAEASTLAHSGVPLEERT